jgi:hypothetical protein
VPTSCHCNAANISLGGNFLYEDGHVYWRKFLPNTPSTIAVGAWNNGSPSSFSYYVKPGDLSLGSW